MFRNAAVLCCLLGALSVDAWAVSPSIGDILPRGAARGSTAEVDVVGNNLSDAVDLMFHDAGITLVELTPVDNGKAHCKLQIAPDCRIGTHAIRIRTKSGVSNLRLFSVGSLNEIQDTEPNNDPATVASVPLGTTINGSIDNEDVDYFAVDLQAGQRLTAEVEAIRLGGPLFDAKLRLFGPAGHELVSEDDTALLAQDAAFVYHAAEAGRYVLAVSEAAYGGGGGFYYRLHVGQFPRPFAVTPMGGQPGAQANVRWLGDADVPAQTITLASDVRGLSPIDPSTDLGVAPSPIPFRISDLPDTLEAEPNNEPGQATAGVAPGAFDGVIEAAGDSDFYCFDGTKGQVYDVRVYAREMGSPLDSILTVYNPSGGALADNDDAVGVDSAFRITLAEDGRHVIRVTDHLGAGGAAFAYRVEVAPVKPVLKLGFLENDAACIVAPQGNRAFLLLSAARADFDGPLKLTFDGLPQGMTADFDPFAAGQGVIPVVFSAAPDSPVGGGLASVTGKLDQEGADVQGGIDYNVVLLEIANKVPFFVRNVNRLATAVGEAAPFSIELVAPKAPVVQNGSMTLKVAVTRKEGFTAPISLRIPWLPSGVGAGTADVPENGTEAGIIINASNGAALGKYRLAVVGSSSGYTVSTSLTPVEIAKPWVTFEVAKVETEQGKPTQLVVTVNQGQEYAGSYKAELLGLPKGVTSQPQDISHDTTQLTFPIEVAADAPAGKFEGLFVRSVLSFEGEDVLNQSGGGALTIFEPLPPTLQAPEPAPAPTPEQPKPEEPQRKTRFPKTA
ncbi:MAG: PPC domain-containing protein [Candidatus Hydrogenedentes bacterium]|nr:PPC domain-containing protein [Candidatus Hydrogenedentota bacterium]